MSVANVMGCGLCDGPRCGAAQCGQERSEVKHVLSLFSFYLRSEI